MTIIGDANALLLKSSDLGSASGVLIDVDVARAGWEFTGLTVVKLAPGEPGRARPGRTKWRWCRWAAAAR